MKQHFTPEKGWMNDPNGLIKIDGIYHIFFQYYPDDIKWGPMHWGHATSTDGITFEEMPVALAPDENGYIFSGSAILDRDGVSGLLAKDEKPALLLFYTSHDPKTERQEQCVAYSTDYVHFTKYEKNPIIANPYGSDGFRKDFRDPKVFANPILGGYSMVVAAGEWLMFYHSFDLLSWKETGTVNMADVLGTGICECPDCMQFGEDWVLTLSYIPFTEKPEQFTDCHTMNYFVGRFDGRTWIFDEKEPKNLLLDYGPDNYAMVSFSNTNEHLMMGWGENWDYVYDVPAVAHRGKLTVIRRAQLLTTAYGKRLSFAPIEGVLTRRLSVNCHETVALSKYVTLTVTDKQLLVRRTCGQTENRLLQKEGFHTFAVNRVYTGESVVEILEDNHYMELYLEGGQCISLIELL